MDQYRGIVPEELERRVHYHLERAGVCPITMLAALRKHKSLVSGSTLLPILLGSNFKPNDLDVYVPEEFEIPMLDVIRHKFEFISDRTNSNSYFDNSSILRVHWLRKGYNVINLIVVSGDNAAIAMFYFHSTIVMNYLSGYGVFCGYADLTLARKSLPNVSFWTTDHARHRCIVCFNKYVDRGITYLSNFATPHVCGEDKSCPATFRTLHDEGSLFIPLPSVTTAELTPPVYDGSNSVAWCLGGKICSVNGVYNRIFATSIPVFQVNPEDNTARDEREKLLHARIPDTDIIFFDEFLMERVV